MSPVAETQDRPELMLEGRIIDPAKKEQERFAERLDDQRQFHEQRFAGNVDNDQVAEPKFQSAEFFPDQNPDRMQASEVPNMDDRATTSSFRSDAVMKAAAQGHQDDLLSEYPKEPGWSLD